MQRQLSHEWELSVPASDVWEIYGTLKLVELLFELVPNVFSKVVIEGDGGVGTILAVTLPPGKLGSYKKIYTKVDNKKRLKESEITEGGYLGLGLRWYRVRYEILEKDAVSSIIRSTIDYEINEDSTVDDSLITTKPYEMFAKVIGNYLIREKVYANDL